MDERENEKGENMSLEGEAAPSSCSDFNDKLKEKEEKADNESDVKVREKIFNVINNKTKNIKKIEKKNNKINNVSPTNDKSGEEVLKKKRGRDKKTDKDPNENNEGDGSRKTKFNDKNVTTKIKTTFFRNCKDCLNRLLALDLAAKGLKNQLFVKEKDKITKVKFVGMNRKITGQLEVEKTREYLCKEKTLEDLYLTEELNDKSRKSNSDGNRMIVAFIKENELENSLGFLKIKIVDLFILFSNNKSDFLADFQPKFKQLVLENFLTLKDYCEKKENNSKYVVKLMGFARDKFLEYYKEAKSRNRKHKKNIDLKETV